MKRRSVLFTLLTVLIVITAVFFIWFFNSEPRLDANEITGIQQYRLPSPPEIITVTDEETINQFADCFNTLNLTPILHIRFPGGGWIARDSVQLKNWGFKLEIILEKANDEQALVKVNHRYFKVDLSAFEALLDIISNSAAEKS